MSKDLWFKWYERKLGEAEERGLTDRRAEDWAADEATKAMREQLADRADRLSDEWKEGLR